MKTGYVSTGEAYLLEIFLKFELYSKQFSEMIHITDNRAIL
ncbi:MAG: hypothetical protein V4585_13700 [Bacteroidota bacterium]